MIRDRGSIELTAMMLLEHIVELRNWMNKKHYVECQELSDRDLQSIWSFMVSCLCLFPFNK
ncbi:hypothetical protein FQ087_03010 [Sporosarcina sp. ANT_H38]|uniref:hypothetical protein n=1 Tax=Sporosarcina sp. ANT_H38 TaxID=2597358 RepID=UPI0011F0FF7C|nr:hypothetical protein [Sporosarcina sp. ANT_H38]KAA0965294.1 hypothetical protein FQ087_03010 [Sporosarcina sp. ANT_H38]